MNTKSVESKLSGGNLRGALKKSKSAQVETGRVEKGNVSNQQMGYVEGNFWYTPFATINWQIKPTSVKPYTAAEIGQQYCDVCGTRVKKISAKFCYNCGSKL
jgi:hypothetical protein